MKQEKKKAVARSVGNQKRRNQLFSLGVLLPTAKTLTRRAVIAVLS